jgi:hypothetical protein
MSGWEDGRGMAARRKGWQYKPATENEPHPRFSCTRSMPDPHTRALTWSRAGLWCGWAALRSVVGQRQEAVLGCRPGAGWDPAPPPTFGGDEEGERWGVGGQCFGLSAAVNASTQALRPLGTDLATWDGVRSVWKGDGGGAGRVGFEAERCGGLVVGGELVLGGWGGFILAGGRGGFLLADDRAGVFLAGRGGRVLLRISGVAVVSAT